MAAEIDAKARAKLLDLLVAGASKAHAAREAGYARTHVYRLLDDPTFKVELAERRHALAVGKLAAEAAAKPGAEVEEEPASHSGEEARSLEVLAAIRDGRVHGEAKDLAVMVSAARAILSHCKKPLVTAPRGEAATSTGPVLKVLSEKEDQARDQARAREELDAWRKTLPR